MNRDRILMLMLLFAGVLGLAVYAHTDPTPYKPPPLDTVAYSDVDLYRDITRRVQAGENFYAATGDQLRGHDYPTKPAMTFRLPTEAFLLAGLRLEILRWGALWALALVAFLTAYRRLESLGLPMAFRLGGIVVFATGITNVVMPGAPYVHEVWAMLLACIALAVWRPGRYWPSVAIALLACLFRETAALFLLAFAACAAFERRWRETAAWCGAAVLLAAVCAVHLGVASHYSLPGDYTSPSWLRFGGWRFVITTARRSSLFASLPGEAISVAMTLCLLGMTQARGVWERRLMAATFAYVGLFLIAGRPDNYYWGILYAPLFPLGALYLIRLRSFMSFQLNRPAAGQTVS